MRSTEEPAKARLPTDPEELARLSAEAIGVRILRQIAAASRPINRRDYIGSALSDIETRAQRSLGLSGVLRTGYDNAIHAHPEVSVLLAEGWAWLLAEGLIAVSPFVEVSGRVEDTFIITRFGKRVSREGSRGPELVRAHRRLGLDLHKDLADELRDLITVGAFEEAAFTALRLVEQRVRTLSGSPRNKEGHLLVGVPLSRQAFGQGGPLADPATESGEQQGVSDLFAGAFGAVRNPLGHASVQWTDPTEAAEFVLFADLLMRRLSHVEARLAAASEAARAVDT